MNRVVTVIIFMTMANIAFAIAMAVIQTKTGIFATKKLLLRELDMVKAELAQERADHARLKAAINLWNTNHANDPSAKASMKAHMKEFTPDYLKALGLSKGCKLADVERAFRKLAMTAHPDKGGTAAKFVALKRARDEALAAMGARA